MVHIASYPFFAVGSCHHRIVSVTLGSPLCNASGYLYAGFTSYGIQLTYHFLFTMSSDVFFPGNVFLDMFKSIGDTIHIFHGESCKVRQPVRNDTHLI